MEQYIIKGGNPLVGEVVIGGAKNAALGILAAAIMTDGECLIDNMPNVRDTNVLLQAMEGIGATIDRKGDNEVVISGKNIDVTQGLKDAVYEKLGKLEKYFTPETEAIVTLSVEKNRQKIEVTVPVKGSVIRAEQVSDDMYVSIDLVQEIIERQMRKHKTRLVNRNRGGGNFQKAFIEMEVEDPDEVQIVRTKKFAMKPMDPEEACVQMELLGHNFFVFRNAETDDVSVVYKRKGNTYGLIEPEY